MKTSLSILSQPINPAIWIKGFVIINKKETINIGDKAVFNGKLVDVTKDFYQVCKRFVDNKIQCYKVVSEKLDMELIQTYLDDKTGSLDMVKPTI